MLKLHHIFFYNFLGIFFISFLLETVVSYLFLKEFEMHQSKEHLKTTLELAQMQVYQSSDFDQLVVDLHEATRLRFTLITANGTVIAESNKDKLKMDNHLQRVEIVQAKSDPYGAVVRYSKTLKQDYLYMAKRISLYDHTYYLRASIPLHRINEEFLSNWLQITSLFAFFIAIGFFISYRISHRVEEDVHKLISYLKEVANKNYKAPLRPTFSKEFAHIAITLKQVIAKLERRERQKRKYTAKLRLINKQRNDLLSAVSHEFKNPLAAIQGYAQTLQNEDLTQENRTIFTNFLEKIVLNSQKISSMIDRIALSIKLENNDLQIKREPCHIEKIAKEAISTIKKKYPLREISFEGPTDIIVNVDPAMIEMVIVNLLDNAMKYSQEGVRVKITPKRLSIVDHGIGIEKDEIDKIRSKFYRVEKNTWDNSLGLGLAIVGYILNLHEMPLEIESQVAKGSIFSFRFQP